MQNRLKAKNSYRRVFIMIDLKKKPFVNLKKKQEKVDLIKDRPKVDIRKK
ncbi:hypothetical protein CHCC14600_4265 [Bacillus licheniformis]|nr:hypothetical protein CHCC14600_4265 [Bacillus licheniformis]